ncbi:uncharacterized protein ARMOST_16799 [Armillaria ostoyae]|uniref:Uncharacterized protein n=1 Tax=Armillaria ostoyae TaxID=47428 RepID=A0A284RX68_ARMOS|nr:uncharacterized protein ARMOST_16799 [Armillaria ostoyae]
MTSIKQSTRAFLRDLLSRYDWVSTSSHSPELIALVSGNAVPTAFQAAQLEASIDDLDAPITKIQSAIDLLRNAAESLEAKTARLKDIRSNYRAALSPIRRLPSEILVEILRWTPKAETQLTALDPYHVFGFNVFKITEGPWQLGHVCSSWRDAVRFLCPEIWSTLKITWQRKRSEKEDIMIPAPKKDMPALLNRACRRFYEYPDERADEPEEMSQCFDLLLTHSKRWGSVELAIVPSFLSRLSLVRGRVDRVEGVCLTCAPITMPGTIDAFEIAPKLKTLDLTGMHAEAHIPFPAENLVLFSDARRLLDHDTVPRYLDIIASAPNLSDFSYHHHSVVPQSPGPYHPQIVHQSLQTLSASLGALLCSLVVSASTQMTLASIKSEPDVTVCPRDALFHIHNLVVRSDCSLATLAFVDATMDENLLPILRLSPQLVSISFQDKQWSRDSVATMESLLLDMKETIRVGDALHHTLIPCLKHLEFVEFDTELPGPSIVYTPTAALFLAALLTAGAQHTATDLIDTASDKKAQGQTGINECGTMSSQDSMCQNLYINAIDDLSVSHLRRTPRLIMHLPAPSIPGPHRSIERSDVSWCLKSERGTRIIPEGTSKGAHFMQTPDFVQVTGLGDFTQLNIHGDEVGGEPDRNGSDLARNLLRDFICSSAFGTDMRDQVFDSMRNMPAADVFESCLGDSGEDDQLMGTVTFHPGDAPAPILSSSQSTTVSAIGGATATGSSAGPHLQRRSAK